MKDDKAFSRDLFVKSGQKGGKKTAERGTDYYKKIGKLGSDKRWSKDNPGQSHQK